MPMESSLPLRADSLHQKKTGGSFTGSTSSEKAAALFRCEYAARDHLAPPITTGTRKPQPRKSAHSGRAAHAKLHSCHPEELRGNKARGRACQRGW